jgi:hypothetical protein
MITALAPRFSAIHTLRRKDALVVGYCREKVDKFYDEQVPGQEPSEETKNQLVKAVQSYIKVLAISLKKIGVEPTTCIEEEALKNPASLNQSPFTAITAIHGLYDQATGTLYTGPDAMEYLSNRVESER